MANDIKSAELCLNAVMIVTIAVSVQKLYEKVWTLNDLLIPAVIGTLYQAFPVIFPFTRISTRIITTLSIILLKAESILTARS